MLREVRAAQAEWNLIHLSKAYILLGLLLKAVGLDFPWWRSNRTRCAAVDAPRDLRPKLSLLKRLRTRMDRTWKHSVSLLWRTIARNFYALPWTAASNPRRNLTDFGSFCYNVGSFPALPQTNRHWYLRIREPESIRRTASFTVNEADAELFEAGARRFQSGSEFKIPEVFLAHVQDAELRTNDVIVRSSGRQIFVDSALNRLDVLEENGILDTVVWPKPRKRYSKLCLLSTPWSDRFYYHWLLDALPRLEIVERFRELDTVPLLVSSPMRNYHKETLALMGVSSDRLAPFDGSPLRVDELYFPSLLSSTGNSSPQAISWLRSRFLPPECTELEPSRLIYVTRRDASQRRLINEPEIVEFLKIKGFEIVCPGDLSFPEQVSLFRTARVIIGPHGAAFSNMVFAPPSTTLIELFGDNYVNGCFWTITNILGQRHASLVGPSAWLDFTIPLPKVQAAIRTLCPFL